MKLWTAALLMAFSGTVEPVHIIMGVDLLPRTAMALALALVR